MLQDLTLGSSLVARIKAQIEQYERRLNEFKKERDNIVPSEGI